MRFHTIVITKRKITALLICAATVTVVCAGGRIIKNHKTAETFSGDKPVYEEVLSEGLPDSSDRSMSAGDIIKKILGFDTDEPQSIISEASPIFSVEDGSDCGTDNEDAQKSEEMIANEEQLPEEQTSEETPQLQNEKPRMPTREEICTSKGMEVNNATNYAVDANSACAEDLTFALDQNGPQVLIMHTHTTECYLGDEAGGGTDRSANESKNVVAVGNVVREVLEEYGIECIHDKTVHDYPSYQGAYTRALNTINSNLQQYPSIKVVLDIHRDAYVYPDGSKLRVACEQNGVSTAKVMLVAGSDSMGLSNPSWRENFKFAAKIQNAAQIMYPGLMRSINLRNERFNMHMTSGSLLMEVGSNGNTLDEAKEGARDAAYAIAAVLTQ